MSQRELLGRGIVTLCAAVSGISFAQNEPSGGAGAKDSSSTTEENSESSVQERRRTRNVVSGTGVLMILPHVDAGYISTSPLSTNIFSKLETPANGWLVEPKFGLGVFSKKISLDLLLGAQIASLSGKIKAKAERYDFADEPVELLPEPEKYSSQQTVPAIEGNARIRFGKGNVHLGVSATALVASKMALYSSLPNQGLKYGVLVGPQFVYEDRDLGNYFRITGTVQLSATGNQRRVIAVKIGGTYGYLLNAPYLTVNEKKIVKSTVRVDKKVVTTRNQKLVESENVSFVFDSQQINFRFNSADLTEKSAAFVAGLAQIFAAQYSDWQSLVVEGHTDSKGNNDYNKKLSQRRAESVRNILIQNGLDEKQVTAVGYGEEKLLIQNETTDLDFAKNRRVEIKVNGMKDNRIIQRSIIRLQQDIFGMSQEAKPSDSGEAPSEQSPSIP